MFLDNVCRGLEWKNVWIVAVLLLPVRCVPLHNYVPSSSPQYLIAAHKKHHYKIFREQYLNTNY